MLSLTPDLNALYSVMGEECADDRLLRDTMTTIVAVSDIHGHVDWSASTREAMTRADMVLVAGDITDFGGPVEARAVIAELSHYARSLFAIPGNCDDPRVADMLRESDIDLHGKVRCRRGIFLCGIGGSPPLPFGTQDEHPEEALTSLIKRTAAADGRIVLVTHAPPRGTRVDRALIGNHAGSSTVRRVIERLQPDLCVCGHIHEARGIDRLGKTLIVNPGPLRRGYAWLEVGTEITCRLCP